MSDTCPTRSFEEETRRLECPWLEGTNTCTNAPDSCPWHDQPDTDDCNMCSPSEHYTCPEHRGVRDPDSGEPYNIDCGEPTPIDSRCYNWKRDLYEVERTGDANASARLTEYIQKLEKERSRNAVNRR